MTLPARATDLPATPPPGVLAEVYAAYRRVEALAEDGVSVDFAHDGSGRLAITLRDRAGARALRPSQALDLLY